MSLLSVSSMLNDYQMKILNMALTRYAEKYDLISLSPGLESLFPRLYQKCFVDHALSRHPVQTKKSKQLDKYPLHASVFECVLSCAHACMSIRTSGDNSLYIQK